MAATKDIKEKVRSINKKLDRIFDLEDELKEARDDASQVKEKMEALGLDNAEDVDDLKALVSDEKMKELESEIHSILDEREMEMKDLFGGARKASLTERIGDRAVKSVGDTNFSAGQKAMIDLKGEKLKDITRLDASGGPLVDEDYQEEIYELPLRTPSIVDLLTVIATDSNAVEYVLQSSETDNAAPQAGENTDLGKTDMDFSLETETVETIGHILTTSAQILEDAPRLRDFARTRMRQLLELEVEDNVLFGDGTSGALNGLVPRSADYDSGLESAVIQGGRDVSDLDRIRIAMLQVQRANFAPTGIVMSPLNFTGIQLEQTNEGAYRFVNPQNQTAPRLWGLPVAVTNSFDEGEAHVGAYSMAATFYDRQETQIEVSTEHSDNFRKLMATFRAYVRAALAVQYQDALVHLTNLEVTAPSAGS